MSLSGNEEGIDTNTEIPSEKRKRSEKSSSMDSVFGDTQKMHDLIYGKEATGHVLLRPNEVINLIDVNKLVLSILADSSFIPWAFIQGRPLIKKCVILHVPGIGADLWEEKKDSSLKSVFEIFGRPVISITNHATTTATQGVSALLTVFIKSKKKDSNKKKEKKKKCESTLPCSFNDLLATKEQLENYGFPLFSQSSNDDMLEYKRTSQNAKKQVEVAALDCEMCETVNGSELTRLSLVDINGTVLIDTLVKPPNPITDYRTPFSGITPAMMKDETTTLEMAQDWFCEFVGTDTILIGHSLENDLHALKIVHEKIVDTVIIFPHPGGFPKRSSLKYLANKHLMRTIHTGSHDSIVDAQIALDLAKMKKEKGLSFGIPGQSTRNLKSLAEVLNDHGIVSCLIDRTSILSRHAHSSSHALPCTSDQEAKEKLLVRIKKPERLFIWSQFQDLYRYWVSKNSDDLDQVPPEETLDEVLNKVDQTISQIYEAAPVNTLVMVTTAHGDTSAAIKKHTERTRRIAKLDDLPSWNETEEREWFKLSSDVVRGLVFANVKDSR